MTSLRRVRRCLVSLTVACGLIVAGAPAALAAPNSVVISGLDPGPVGVSGTLTFTPPASTSFLNVTVGLPKTEYSTAFTGTCASNGITVAINGTLLSAMCRHGSFGSLYNTLEVYNYWSSPSLSTSDVITLTWGTTAVTRTGPASSSAFAVSADLAGQGFTTYLTPTTSGSSSTSEAVEPDLTMWHQSIGRESSSSPCPSGYTESWAHWPHGNQGGWVCNRRILAYRANPDS